MSNLTDFSPLSSGGFGPAGGRSLSGGRLRTTSRPPRGFHPIYGEPSNVRFDDRPLPPSGHYTRAQRLGLAYEERVHDILSSIYDVDYRAHPALVFEDRRGYRRAIPDGILKLGRTLVVVEIKLTHCERAWWQLRRLYIPLLSRLTHEDVIVRGVEICMNFDPDLRWPDKFDVLKSLHNTTNNLGVLQWRV